MHDDIISRRSPFFKKAISKRKKSARPGKAIELLEHDAMIFDVYLQCVYHDAVLESEVDHPLEFYGLLELYEMAEEFGDLKAANTIIDELVMYSDRLHHVPSRHLIASVYKRWAENSPLRKLMVDWYTYEGPGAVCLANKDCVLPYAFLNDLYMQYGQQLCNLDSSKSARETFSKHIRKSMPKCQYHQHDDSLPPCKDDVDGDRSKIEAPRPRKRILNAD